MKVNLSFSPIFTLSSLSSIVAVRISANTIPVGPSGIALSGSPFPAQQSDLSHLSPNRPHRICKRSILGKFYCESKREPLPWRSHTFIAVPSSMSCHHSWKRYLAHLGGGQGILEDTKRRKKWESCGSGSPTLADSYILAVSETKVANT
jgi:hypothetical protein